MRFRGKSGAAARFVRCRTACDVSPVRLRVMYDAEPLALRSSAVVLRS